MRKVMNIKEVFVGAILPPDEYERLGRLQAYFEALQLSKQLAHLQVSAVELAQEARQELEKRAWQSR
jgi:hypothetical protein